MKHDNPKTRCNFEALYLCLKEATHPRVSTGNISVYLKKKVYEFLLEEIYSEH
jgi:hypothetical protein